jgi:hypothetical protein
MEVWVDREQEDNNIFIVGCDVGRFGVVIKVQRL